MGTVLEELTQRVLAKVAKIEHCNERIKQFKQNRLFIVDQIKLFAEFNGQTQKSKEILDADQIRVFWSGIWSESKEHNTNAECLKKVKEEDNC